MPLPLLLVPAVTAATGFSSSALISALVGGVSLGAASIAAFFHLKKPDATQTLAHQESLLQQEERLKLRVEATNTAAATTRRTVDKAASDISQSAKTLSFAVAALEANTKVLSASSTTLQSSIDSSAKAVSQSEEYSKLWKEMQDMLSATKQQYASMQEALSQSQTSQHQMQAVLKKSEDSISALCTTLADTQHQLNLHQKDIQRLDATLACQTKEIDTLNETIRVVTEQKNMLEKQKKALLDENGVLIQEKNAHLANINSLSEQLSTVIRANQELRAKYLALKQSNIRSSQDKGAGVGQAGALSALGLLRAAPASGAQGTATPTAISKPSFK